MHINQINNSVIPVYFMKNSGKVRLRQSFSVANPEISSDSPSFKGTFHPVNSSRKYIDYGDIFQDGVKLLNKPLKKARELGVRMRDADLTGSDFRKSAFYAGLFGGTDFTGTNFEFSNLSFGQFINIITKDTNFRCVNFERSIFSGDRFGVGTNMQKANVAGANFSDADISKIDFINAIYDKNTVFPSGFDPKGECMRFLEPGADFSNMEHALEELKLRYLEFTNVNFQNSSLKRTDLKECRFNNCNMHNTRLKRAFARGAVFENCDLSGSNLKQLNLKDAELINCDLSNCNLKGAILKMHLMSNTKLKGSKYDQYTGIEGFNPRDYGMIYEKSLPSYYGIRG